MWLVGNMGRCVGFKAYVWVVRLVGNNGIHHRSIIRPYSLLTTSKAFGEEGE